MGGSLLEANQIDFSYNGHLTLEKVDIQLKPGECVALLGPNGSGKTTLLKTLCGIFTPRAGSIKWNGENLAAMHRREIARNIAMVPQELSVPFAFTVREMVTLGRTPYVRPLFGETIRDHHAVDRALEMTETSAFANRLVSELSGGEQQRVVIAMALAQEPQVLLLDEPTVHLDINHQIQVLELVRKLNRECGLTVLATMHDMNLSSLYFDRLILLRGGKIITQGKPRDVLSQEQVRSVFDTEVIVQSHPVHAHIPHIVLIPQMRMPD
jgi:iron complex transport system ATP-binding protein